MTVSPGRAGPPRRRVAITGMAVATALGLEVDEVWDALLAGRYGLAVLPPALADLDLPARVAGRVGDAPLAAGVRRYRIEARDRGDQLALYVVGRALETAGWPVGGESPLALDVLVGTGHGPVSVGHEAARLYLQQGWRRLRPTTVVRAMFNRAANLASIRYRLTGASFTLSAACASGAVALGEAYHRVALGLSEGAVAACADTGLDPITFAAWNRLGVLSTVPDPEVACRPFDARRDGLVMGEGGAAFVLEPLDAAVERGAAVLAEVLGYGCTSDAHHIVRPDAAGQVRAVRAALDSAGLPPEAIDYVCAHGTATDLADVVEAASLREALGDHGRRVPVSNTKAQLGHLMGATAGVELALTVLALDRGLIPSCRNLDDPDPRCALSFVRGAALARPLRVALKNSFAFGGTNAAIILGRPD